jgi:hypothetical protein
MNDVGRLKVKRGEVVGIGKIKIPRSQDFDYEIQMLSFLVIKESGNSFISTCIHLRMDGYGKTVDDAKQDMVENIYYFLCENFKTLGFDDAWDNLRSLFRTDDWSDELWDAYHEVQIQLSMQGRPTDNVENLLKRLDQLTERVKQLESEESHKLAGEITRIGEDLIVDYTPLEKAA